MVTAEDRAALAKICWLIKISCWQTQPQLRCSLLAYSLFKTAGFFFCCQVNFAPSLNIPHAQEKRVHTLGHKAYILKPYNLRRNQQTFALHCHLLIEFRLFAINCSKRKHKNDLQFMRVCKQEKTLEKIPSCIDWCLSALPQFQNVGFRNKRDQTKENIQPGSEPTQVNYNQYGITEMCLKLIPNIVGTVGSWIPTMYKNTCSCHLMACCGSHGTAEETRQLCMQQT